MVHIYCTLVDVHLRICVDVNCAGVDILRVQVDIDKTGVDVGLHVHPALDDVFRSSKSHADRDQRMIEVSLFLQVDALSQVLKVIRCDSGFLFATNLFVDALDHGLRQCQSCAFPLTLQLPGLGGVEEVESFFVVIELRFAGSHVPEDIVHQRNPFKTILVEHSGLILKIFISFESLFKPTLLHPLQSHVVVSFEAFIGKLLL